MGKIGQRGSPDIHCLQGISRTSGKQAQTGEDTETAKAQALVMDTMTKAERSERMALIRSKDTKPELAVRRLIHSLGYRYRLHGKGLPGHPDLVFAGKSKVIFVHGCFWHLHRNCASCRPPKSRLEYWKPKLETNAARDKSVRQRLRRLGWRCLVIWECEIDDSEALVRKIKEYLE